MKGPDSIIGKTVKCPACQMQFSVTGTPPPPEPEPMVAQLAEEGETDVRRQRSSVQGNWLLDFIVFRRMITPIFIQIIFWLGVLLLLYWGVSLMWDSLGGTKEIELMGQKTTVQTKFSFKQLLLGLAVFCFGPIYWRVVCETTIIFFRMNESLTDIRHGIDRMGKG
jgi:hypothetical protein